MNDKRGRAGRLALWISVCTTVACGGAAVLTAAPQPPPIPPPRATPSVTLASSAAATPSAVPAGRIAEPSLADLTGRWRATGGAEPGLRGWVIEYSFAPPRYHAHGLGGFEESGRVELVEHHGRRLKLRLSDRTVHAASAEPVEIWVELDEPRARLSLGGDQLERLPHDATVAVEARAQDASGTERPEAVPAGELTP